MAIPRHLVDATDLHHWSRQRTAQADLPKLVRRLILATRPRPLVMGVPSGEGVQMGGWDGLVESPGAPPFVPEGVSAWEFSTRRDVRTKANEDYEKRTDNPRGVDRATTTFVFVTSCRWGGKDDWARERRAEAKWKDVRVLDADDLEGWLEDTLAVHVWITDKLGRPTDGVAALEEAWREYVDATQPPFSAELVIAGREEFAKALRAWAESDDPVLTLKADTREEAWALFAGAVDTLPEPQRERVWASTVLVRDAEAGRFLCRTDGGLTLIPVYEGRQSLMSATGRGHRVLVPYGRGEVAGAEAKTAPRASRGALHDTLLSVGIPKAVAGTLAGIGRRSLAALRRRLAAPGRLAAPEWARPANGGAIVPAVLAGAWEEASERDEEALAELSLSTYGEFARVVARWANEEDPPARLVGSVWAVTSKEDAWGMVHDVCTKEQIEAFVSVCEKVLVEVDPKFDLPPERHWSAGLFLRDPRYSSRLRRGLADSLALLAATSGTYDPPGAASGQQLASMVVMKVLGQANADWRVWASLSDSLPLLAEAAPEQFLAAVETGSGRADPVLGKVFFEDHGVFSSMPHTGLLWGLERLAWSARYLAPAAVLLVKLAGLETDDCRANRPLEALVNILRMWHPYTLANLDQRMDAIDAVLRHVPDMGWELLVELLPERGGGAAFPTSQPERRDWVRDDDGWAITYGEIWDGTARVVDRLLARAGVSGTRWAQIVESIDVLRVEPFEKVVSALEVVAEGGLSDGEARLISDALRGIVARHTRFPDAKWALPADRVEQLAAIQRRLEPSDPLERNQWLFAEHPASMDFDEEGNAGDEDRPSKGQERREQAVRDVVAAHGLEGLQRFAEAVKFPAEMGQAAGHSGTLSDQETAELLASTLTADGPLGDLARGVCWGTSLRVGSAWAGTILASAATSAWSAAQRAALLLSVPRDAAPADLAKQLGEEVERAYWAKASPRGYDGYAEAEPAAKMLLRHGRPYSALTLLHLALRKGEEPDSWESMLEALNGPEHVRLEDDPTPMLAYAVEEALERLSKSADVPRERLARLEWMWLPLLEHRGRSAPRVLYSELAQNPGFFCELVALAYRADDEAEKDASDEEIDRATRAQRLISSWDGLPGHVDGSLDHPQLSAWVEAVLSETERTKRGTVGHHLVGEVLSRSPTGEDGSWPHEAVREILETVESPDLEEGFRIGLYNSGEVVTKSPLAGGDRERGLAARYEAYAEAMGKWPRTAAVLRRIAAGYLRDADREDRGAELREDHGLG